MFRKLWRFFRNCWLVEAFRSLVPHRWVNLFWHLPRAILANIFYGFPSRELFVIGVTGTDGKTTTSTLIYEILQRAGKKVALISTLSAKIGKKEIPTGLHVTSPDSFVLQKLLRKIVGKGIKYVVLESTSHGLAQYRLWGVGFKIGAVTNVTQEHLDYHGTYGEYLKAKGKLFDGVRVAVLNRDDKSYEYLSAKRKVQSAKLITYGIKGRADLTPENFKFRTSLFGEHNQYNCLAAIAVARAVGVSEEKIRKAIASFKGVVGRMEEVKAGQDFRVLVDFAHTPNALKNALETMRSLVVGRHKVIAVFGCAGLRDQYKRPMMGKIAAELADVTVLTAEDPRTEDVDEIIDQIAEACKEGGAVEKSTSEVVAKSTSCEVKRKKKPIFYRVPDRRGAIRFAIQKLAKKRDVVGIFGKGHEQSMCFGKTEYPWSDIREAKKVLKGVLK